MTAGKGLPGKGLPMQTANAPASNEGEAGADIELHGIEKRFGSLVANRDVRLAIRSGTIHGIVGENGAGKSTLMKILAGWDAPDAGEIRLFGKPVRFRNSAEAARHGITMVFQHFMMADRLSVIDNMLLFHKGPFYLSKARYELSRRLETLMDEYGLAIPLDVAFEQLPLGMRQRAEILKALLGDARIIILDEPTAVLTPQEVTELFRVLRELKAEGRTILFVTHKLHEVMELCDRVTVMRLAQVVGTHDIGDVTPQLLAHMMIGRSDLATDPERPPVGASVRLEVRHLRLVRGGRLTLDIESLEVAQREIVGIAGVSGNGQSELLDVLSGQIAPTEGTMRLGSSRFDAGHWPNAHEARRIGIGHIPEDRQGTGLLLDLAIRANLVLGHEHRPENSRRGILDLKGQFRTAQGLVTEFDIRARSVEDTAGSLSGGNQQKIVVARELHIDPDLLLVGQPTRGVDIGSIQNIHGRLIAYRNSGGSILLVSSELEELFALCDRLLVAFDGRLHGAFPRSDFDDPRIGQYMAGVF